MQRIPLYGRRSVVRAWTVVDDADHVELSRRRWHLCAGYAADRDKKLMHRELLGLVKGDGLEVDHINGDRLDNRRQNLRVVTHAVNLQNRRGAVVGSISAFRGVTLDPRTELRKRWLAQIKRLGRNHFLGRYETEAQAAAAVERFLNSSA